MPRKNPVPAPVVVTTVCSMCGLDWERHGADPTTEDCIRLLKAELARRPVTIPVMQPVPYPQPYPVPRWPYPRGPIWSSHSPTITRGTNTIRHAPRLSENTCMAVSA